MIMPGGNVTQTSIGVNQILEWTECSIATWGVLTFSYSAARSNAIFNAHPLQE